jgi:hypothetical protein
VRYPDVNATAGIGGHMVRAIATSADGLLQKPTMARPPSFRPVPDTRPRLADNLNVIAEPLLRRLADYWLSRRAGRLMPSRGDIDPLDIPWALPHLFLIDCIADAGRGADGGRWRYRYRLAGEEIEGVLRRGTFGRHSLRGVWLDEFVGPQHIGAVMARWRPLPEDGCIVYMQGMVYRTAECFARGGRLMLPLAEQPGGPVTGLIGAAECDWACAEPEDAASSLPADLVITYIPAAALG